MPSYVIILGIGLVIVLLLVAFISPILRADERQLDDRLENIEESLSSTKKNSVEKNKNSIGGTKWAIFDTPEMQALLPNLQNHRIDAIKLYREHTGVGLKEASEAIADYLDSHLHEQKG